MTRQNFNPFPQLFRQQMMQSIPQPGQFNFQMPMNNQNMGQQQFVSNINLREDVEAQRKLVGALSSIESSQLESLVSQAKNLGISEKDIQDGLNFINQYKTK